ncbi:putative F-box domain-containing protein [Helianthus annuus]|nr:putative F-box protein AUF1 [Helianthus annuus]KAJ0602965.1 putative F-box domain-containing protein [Helianthus annuus]KAJ0775525.1 putative F-box protein AUF1 [Helianthus annuus]KAJ0937728.1 putative F-box domain-containing protein [Helianthus annuus]KAJ0945688.1 putative F-box domain-containing protein [Helianthus annuus]
MIRVSLSDTPSNSHIPKMTSTNKSLEEDDSSSSSLNRLPDEIILQILTKSPDLKTLCILHLVSKRFASIILQIDTISFTAPLVNPNTTSGDITTTGSPKNLFRSFLNGVVLKPIHLLKRMVTPSTKPLPPMISSFYGDSFRSAVTFLSKFTRVKFLSIELPVSNHRGIDNNNNCLFKWNVKFSNRIESFRFLSPNGLSYVNDGNVDEGGNDLDMELTIDSFKRKVHIAFQCLKDVIIRHRMLLYFVKDFPNLEKLSITDSGRRGTLCLSGGRLAEVRGWMDSEGGNVKPEMNRIEVPVNVSQCYVPVLNLPVSGCVMKGVTFVVMRMNGEVRDGDECLVSRGDGFEVEDEVEAAYSEAVVEILENHKDKMKRLL